MALVITKPNDTTTKYIYCGVPNEVDWTDSITGTPSYYVSVNGGSNWTLQTTQVTSVGANSLIWTPSEALLDGNNEVATTKFRIHDDGGNHDSDTFILRRISIVGIRPNADNAIAIYKDDAVNITWENLYSAGIANIKIEVSINGGSTWTEIIASVAANRSYIWYPSRTLSITSKYTNCLIRISCVDTSPFDNTAMITEGTAFTLTNDIGDKEDDLTTFWDIDKAGEGDNTSNYPWSWKDMPNVFPLGAQGLMEKASYMNAGIVLGQVEAINMLAIQRYSTGQSKIVGDSIIYARGSNGDHPDYSITEVMYVAFSGLKHYYQALNSGTMADTLPAAYNVTDSVGTLIKDGGITFRCLGTAYDGGADDILKYAYNLMLIPKEEAGGVISRPRELQRIIDFNGGATQTTGLLFGIEKLMVLNHQWELGNPTDVRFNAGQREGSYQLTYEQITSENDLTSPADEITIQHSTIEGDYNNINLYCVLRDETQSWCIPTIDLTATYIYLVKLKEIIPNG